MGQAGRYNATVDLLERNLSPGRRDRPYLVTSERSWTYEDVAAAADSAGAGLRDLGLEPGDRVVLVLRDRPELVAGFWGAIKAGVVPVPVTLGLTEADLRHLLTDSRARAVVCEEASAPAVLSAAAGTAATPVLIGDTPPGPGREGSGARLWSELCARPAAQEAAATTEDNIALWLYTSGTTGRPKGVLHRHRDLQRAPDGLARQVIGMGPEDVVLSISRMSFGYGLGNSVYLPASVGASVVINGAPAVPARIQGLMDRFRPTVMLGVPAFFAGLVALPDASLPSGMRMVLTAGEALPVPLFERFLGRFGLPLLDGIGSTEALHHVTSNAPDDVVPGSCGPPLEGWDIEVRDRNGHPVAEGTSGELWWRGPTTFAGYWGHPELTAHVCDGDWMRTGDLVHVRDGRLFHEGRLDDLMKMGGIWVRPADIEGVLREHADVEDAAVVAVDTDSGVPVIRAFVVSARPSGDLAPELVGLCRNRLATFKIPASFEVVEELPRTPTGKLRRFALRTGEEVRRDRRP